MDAIPTQAGNVLLFVNYHHVRPNNPKEFPNLPHITPYQLKCQIQLLGRQFDFLNPKVVREIILSKKPFPKNLCVLTFDDGLRDHIDFVSPLLTEMKLSALFFINTAPWLEGGLLPVHKAHLLSAAFSYPLLAQEIENSAHEEGINLSICNVEVSKAVGQYRYDDPETAKVKFFLNALVPQRKRSSVMGRVFRNRIGESNSLHHTHYLSPKDVKVLESCGHLIGLHTHSHLHLASASLEECERDLRENQKCLREAISPRLPLSWVSYPYGSVSSYNEGVIRLCTSLGCDMGLTMVRGINSSHCHSMRLSRCDTNDVEGGKSFISWKGLVCG